MSDDDVAAGGPSDELSPALIGLLGDAATWVDLDAAGGSGSAGEAAVLAAIAREAEAATPPASLAAARTNRIARSLPNWLTAAAAVAVFVAAAAFVIRAVRDDDATEVADGSAVITMDGTDLAPQASATAVIESTPAGLKIVLDAEQLPGAAPGSMYEAWISDGQVRVSAGTFHLRGGDGPIELWAGVADPSFHIITVTLEPVDGVAESSGQVVLAGEYRLGG